MKHRSKRPPTPNPPGATAKPSPPPTQSTENTKIKMGSKASPPPSRVSSETHAAPGAWERARGLGRDEIKVHGVNAALALWRQRPEAVVRVYVTDARLGEAGELLRWCA